MSLDEIIVGHIQFVTKSDKIPFKEGKNIIKNNDYYIYILCKKNTSVDPDEDLTDAEEEITMTQIIGVKSNKPSLTTVIPDSDDESDSNDSSDSIILPSQEERIKRSILSKQNSQLVGDHQSNEDTKDEEMENKQETGEPQPNNIHDLETQLIFKIPDVPGCEKLSTNMSIQNENPDVGDSQLCDFGDFTEEFEVPESQSLLVNMDQIPEPILPPVHQESVENTSEVKDAKNEDCIVLKNCLDEDSSKEENTTLIDDELTQIIDINDVENNDLDIHEVATQMIPKLSHSRNDYKNDIYDMATQTLVENKNIHDVDTQMIPKLSHSTNDCQNDIYDMATQTIVENKNIHDVDTQMIPKLSHSTNDCQNDIYDLATQSIVENKNIHNVDTQMIPKLSHSTNDCQNDIYDMATQSIVENKNIHDVDTHMIPKLSHSTNDCQNDIYDMATQCLVKNENVNDPDNIYDALTQCVTKKEESDEDITDLEDNVPSPPTKTDAHKTNILDEEVGKVEINDGLVNLKNKDNNVEVIDDGNDINMTQTLEDSSATQVCVNNSKGLVTGDNTDDVYNEDTLVVFPESQTNADKNTVGDVDLFKQVTQAVPERVSISPICKPVILTSENFSGETNLDQKSHLKICLPNDSRGVHKIINDGFVFSTPNSQPIKRKKLKYNNTQEIVNLLGEDERKENIDHKQTECYNSTQDVFDDLVQDPTKSFYNSTQEVLNDLLTPKIQSPRKAPLDIPTYLSPTKLESTCLDNNSQSSESSEDLTYKSPQKKRKRFQVTDSELDSPQIELFVSKMLPPPNSPDTEDVATLEESEDIPVVFRAKVPCRPTKRDKELQKKIDSKRRQLKMNKGEKHNIESLEVKNQRNRKELTESRPSNPSIQAEIISEVPQTIKTRRKTIDNKKSSKAETVSEVPHNIKRRRSRETIDKKFAKEDIEKNIIIKTKPNEQRETPKRRPSHRPETSCSESAEIGTRRSSRKRTANRKYEDLEMVKTTSNESATRQTRSGRDTPNSVIDRTLQNELKVMMTSIDCTPDIVNTINSLGGSLVEKDGDVLISPIPCKRTVKIMMAAAKGIPIVTQQWLTKSKSNGSFLDPWSHLLKCSTLEKKYNVLMEKVLRSAKPHLEGYTVYMTPGLVIPQNQLKELVEACGGQAVFVDKTARRSFKAKGKNVMSVSCIEDQDLWPKLPDPLLKMEALLSSTFTHIINRNDTFR